MSAGLISALAAMVLMVGDQMSTYALIASGTPMLTTCRRPTGDRREEAGRAAAATSREFISYSEQSTNMQQLHRWSRDKAAGPLSRSLASVNGWHGVRGTINLINKSCKTPPCG